MTYKAAFEYFATKLKELGVKTVEMFKRIIHAMQSRECEDRRKELEAKREAKRRAETPQREDFATEPPTDKPLSIMDRVAQILARLGYRGRASKP